MNNLRLLSWNVNGLRAVHKKGFSEWLIKDMPDVLCLQETKVQKDQVPPQLKSIPGYFSYFNSGERKGYGGVGIYSRKEPESVKFTVGIEGFDDEHRTIIADYGDFLLFNVYFPNGKASRERLDYKLKFYDLFLDYIGRIMAEDRKIVICGDFNTAHKEIDLARPKANQKISGFLPEERARMDILVENGFLDTFRMFCSEGGNYSWWDLKTRARERNVGWRIDYFFVSANLKDRIGSAFILKEIMGADHCPVGIELLVKTK